MYRDELTLHNGGRNSMVPTYRGPVSPRKVPDNGDLIHKLDDTRSAKLVITWYRGSFFLLENITNVYRLVQYLNSIYLNKNLSWVELNCLFNVTINDISVIYVTAHRCAGGLKKKYDLRSGSQRHRHFVGFFNVPVLAPTRDQPFYTVIPTHRPI